jgi:pilus assembly protein CpaE
MPLRIHRLRSEAGQASVEMVAVLPFVLLVGALCWQFALAGHAAWLSAHAARAGARADAVGADVGAAARSALPAGLERELKVKRLSEGGVRVEVQVPLLLDRWRSPLSVGATSSLGRAER